VFFAQTYKILKATLSAQPPQLSDKFFASICTLRRYRYTSSYDSRRGQRTAVPVNRPCGVL